MHMRASFNKMKGNLKRNWLSELENAVPVSSELGDVNWRSIYHLVILPMYKEPFEVVQRSFLSLSKINYPSDKLIVILATEEAGR